jgi:hypothetical protein
VVALTRLKQQQLVGSIKDRLGRIIVLEQERWEHICEHEQLDGHELAVMRAVENAIWSRDGNYPGSEVLYARNLGPARWLAVVVEYDGLTGRVITAYPYNKEPRIAA